MLAERAGMEPGFAVSIEKRIPVAAGLGGGSSDAAAALRLANELLPQPLRLAELHELAAELGADVPLFLHSSPALATGDGTTLAALALPRDYHVVVWLPDGEAKESTASVYQRFDERHGEQGFEERRLGLLDALAAVRTATDLAALPPNDLAASPHAETLLGLGAFRADVTGAGPALYGLFDDAATRCRGGRAGGVARAASGSPHPSVTAERRRRYTRSPDTGAWPSGKATGFGPVIPGSNPGAPAIEHP